MSIIAVVNNETLKIHTFYPNDVINYKTYKCNMGNIRYFTHVIVDNVPDDVIEEDLDAIRIDGVITVSLNQVRYDSRNNLINEDLISSLRFDRNRLLSESDWTQLPDVALTADQVNECRVYRQELRDLDMTNLNLVFPTAPSVLS